MNLRRAVIILGAGASRGARVTGGRTPPLDTEFLERATAYFHRKWARGSQRDAVSAWRSFETHLRRAGLSVKEVRRWRLEQLSTFLEARASLRGVQLGPGRPVDFARALDALKLIICHVLRADGGTRSCELHRELFRLVEPSAIVSFNYDLIADQSMLELDLLNWRSRSYRGAVHADVPRNASSAYVQVVTPTRRGGTPLLKLHGSMHWARLQRGDGYRLSGCQLPGIGSRLFRYERVPPNPYIVPPVAAKIQIAEEALRERWRLGVDLLYKAPLWILWGYSFPGTDTISHVLFRTALVRNRRPNRLWS